MCRDTAPSWKALDVFCVFKEHRRMKCIFSEENVCMTKDETSVNEGQDLSPASLADSLWIDYEDYRVFVSSALWLGCGLTSWSIVILETDD